MPRSVTTWNTIMFRAATTSSAILARKKVLWAYFTAFEENSSAPVIAASANTVHVRGRISRVSRLTARLLDARPSSRRSTMKMEPTTRVMLSTCTDSTHGNSVPFSRIAVPTGES